MGPIKVVEDTSSYLNAPTIEVAEHIGHDHREMCRFSGLEDIEYKKVEAAIQRIVSKVPRSHEKEKPTERPTTNNAFEIRKEQRRRFLWNSLRFDQINDWRADIQRTHAKTCEWFLRSYCYLDWIDSSKVNEHTGLLWIKGKPGAGKSTLMKFALSQAEKVMGEEVVLSFFFHARGIDLQKSTVGLYRSLLWQILERLPSLIYCFDSAGLVKDDIKYDTKDDTRRDIEHFDWNKPQWNLEMLKDLFEKAVLQWSVMRVRTNPVPLVCFIDALDECEESQIRDMVAFFEHLCERAVTSNIRFRVCFSSRHYPNIKMNRGLDVVLEGQPGHSQDITNYVNSKLEIGHSKLVEQIRQELHYKASGVFMWVVLVVEMLNKEYDAGRIHSLRERLRTIPGDLHELFRDILTRDELHRNELRLSIQWVLFSRRPLSPHELYYAILSGLGANVIEDLAAEEIEITVGDMKRFILDCSKGLVEVVSSECLTVQFIHESVRDFLLRGKGLAKLWAEQESDFQGYSHDLLKRCCVTYLATVDPSVLRLPLEIPESVVTSRKRRSRPPPPPPPPPLTPPPTSISPLMGACDVIHRRFPFLEYAVENVLHHADLAEEGRVSQLSFMLKFEWTNWLALGRLLAKGEFRRRTPKASPLYIFAENNLPNLIGAHPSRFSYFELEDECYGSPLYASIGRGGYQAVRKFLELEVQRQPGIPLLRGLLGQLCSHERCSLHLRYKFERYKFERGPKALNPLITCYNGILAPFLLAAGKNLGILFEDWHSRIITAVFEGRERFTLQLLAAGLDLKPRKTGELVLLRASNGGWVEVFREILTRGTFDMNYCTSRGETPLAIACQQGHIEIVKMLLNTGKVDVDTRDVQGWSPFSRAAQQGYKEIAKLLIDTGEVDLNIEIHRSLYTTTALAIASRKGYIEIVRLLLGTGKVAVNSKSRFGRTPLSLAAERGNRRIVFLLLCTEDIDVNTRDKECRTPLSYAAENGCTQVLSLLVGSPNIDLNVGDRTGWSPLFYAICRRHHGCLKVLLQQPKVNVNLSSSNGLTPLILAARTGHVGIVKLLLKRADLDVNTTTSWGVSALSIAKGEKHQEVVEMLLASGKIKE
jgi:ankyrin repeat protein